MIFPFSFSAKRQGFQSNMMFLVQNGVVSDAELLELLHLALSSDASNTIKRARELTRSRIDPLQLVSQLANLIMDILAGKCEDVSEIRRKLFGPHDCMFHNNFCWLCYSIIIVFFFLPHKSNCTLAFTAQDIIPFIMVVAVHCLSLT